MKKHLALVIIALATLATGFASKADRLVILHTNDTHSQIDPMDNGLGGVLRRKVLIDSVRAAEPNVMLIDAGDAVQGTLFFNLYKGEVEHRVMNHLGYDLAILGNHDFDNGVDLLADNLTLDSITWITTNYDLSASPLASRFVPYVVKQFGDRTIAFIGINLQPKGMISEGNYDGVEFLDIIKAANSTAWHLKHNEKVDMVIAITHIGYDGQPAPHDIDLAANSEDIDIIIGGHSHTTLVDGRDLTRIPDSAGKRVLVTQAGSRGVNLGEITIDLDNLAATSRLIPVDSRLDAAAPDQALISLIEPYRQGIDSIMNVKIARSEVELNSPRLLNLFSDIVLERGSQLADNVDLALLNKGGIRRTLPKGNITEGMIMTTLPFNNRVTVLDLSGADLLEALNIMAARDDQGIAGNVKVVTEGSPAHVAALTINGEPVMPEKTYRVATIDYLANGGDYMVPLTRATVIATSPNVVYADVIDYMRSLGKKKLNPSSTPRFTD